MQNGFKLLIQLWISLILDIVGKQFSTLNTVQQFYTMFCDRSWVIRSNLNRMPSNWSVFVRAYLFFSNQKDAFLFVPPKISTNSFFQRQRIIKNQIGDRYTHLHTHKYDRETKTHHRWVIHFIFIFQSKFSYFVIPTIQSWYLVCMQKIHLFKKKTKIEQFKNSNFNDRMHRTWDSESDERSIQK